MNTNMINVIAGTQRALRFTKEQLTNITAKQVDKICRWHPMIMNSDETIALVKSLGVTTELYASERELLVQHRTDLDRGTVKIGQSLEDAATVKNADLKWTETGAELKYQNGDTVSIPLLPVTPNATRERHIGQEWIDPIVVTFFVLQKGEVRTVPDLKILSKYYATSQPKFNIAGIESIRVMVDTIIRASSVFAQFKSDRPSASGNAFVDLWTVAASELDQGAWYLFQTHVILRLMKDVKLVKGRVNIAVDKDGNSLLPGVQILTKELLNGRPVKPAHVAKTTLGHSVLVFTGPTSQKTLFPNVSADQVRALSLFNLVKRLYPSKSSLAYVR